MAKEKRRIMNINSQFPDEIIGLIFTKLPFFNLPSCRQVCKAWNNLIISHSKFLTPIFNQLYFAHISHHHVLHCFCLDANNGRNILASFNFLPNLSNLRILGSCNGLICFTQSNNTTIKPKTSVGILNPCTNEYIILPTGLKSVSYYYGFGFSSKTNQYKVTRQSPKSHHSFITSIEIFAFGTNQWRHVAFMPLRLTCDGVYFNGAIYWLGCSYRDDVICRLDMIDEKCEEISFPPMAYDRNMYHFQFALGSFNGNLYLTFYTLLSFEYNVFKMECGREEQDSYSWTRTFVISLLPNFDTHPSSLDSFHLRLIQAFENGKILCLCGDHLILYDPKIETVEPLEPSKKLEKILWNLQMDSLNFDSLHTILRLGLFV